MYILHPVCPNFIILRKHGVFVKTKISIGTNELN